MVHLEDERSWLEEEAETGGGIGTHNVGVKVGRVVGGGLPLLGFLVEKVVVRPNWIVFDCCIISVIFWYQRGFGDFLLLEKFLM